MEEELWESKVVGGTTDEGYMGKLIEEGYLDRSALIDSLLTKMEFHANSISALCSKIVCGGNKSEEDWGLNQHTEII